MRSASLLTVLLVAGAAPAAAQDTTGVPTVTLDQAVTLALQVQPAVVTARGDLVAASAARREAVGNWLPSLSGNGSFTRSFSANRVNNVTGEVATVPASNFYNAGLSANLLVFDGFQRPAQNRAAGANVDNADAQLVNQRFQVVLLTKQAFFNSIAAQELVGVAQRRIARADEQLKIARDKLAAGSATRSDTLQSTVERANAQLQLVTAQADLATSTASLARLIGFDGPVRPVSDSALFQMGTLDTARLRLEVVDEAPSVRAAQASARAADAQVQVSRAQYFPTLSAGYSNSWAGTQLDQLLNSSSFRLSLSWPLFNGFSRETSVARASASADAARARAADARRQAQAQFTQFMASLQAAQARMVIARASLAAADEDLRVQRERYRLGAATIVEVLTSQVSVDQAATDLVTARLDFLVAKAQLEALLGREL